VNAAKVKMNKMEFILTDSATTELAMFENNQIDYGGNVPRVKFPACKVRQTPFRTPVLATYFYCFNVIKPPFDNIKVAKLLLSLNDRDANVRTSPVADRNRPSPGCRPVWPTPLRQRLPQTGGDSLRTTMWRQPELLSEPAIPTARVPSRDAHL
jgi:hypothetical protein